MGEWMSKPLAAQQAPGATDPRDRGPSAESAVHGGAGEGPALREPTAGDGAPATCSTAEPRQYGRPENFVRLSKAEKRRLKYERNRSRMLVKRKQVKKRRATKQAALDAVLNDEEWAQVKRQRSEESARQKEKLRAAMMASNLTVAVDLGFLGDNSTREVRSLAQQLTYAYSRMRKEYAMPPKLHITDYRGEAGRVLNLAGAGQWLVHRHEEPLGQVFGERKLVYLSPDAEEPLAELDGDAVYVIGGIVDRTVSANVSRDKAARLGAEARRFPVREFLPHSRKVVLNVDRAIDVLVRFAESGDWEGTLRRIVPKRHQKAEGGAASTQARD